MSGFLITAQSLFSRWLKDISLSLALLTAIIKNSMITVLNKVSATWWSVKPRRERLRNSLGNTTSMAADITPTQRLNNSLPMKYTGITVNAPRTAGVKAPTVSTRCWLG